MNPDQKNRQDHVQGQKSSDPAASEVTLERMFNESLSFMVFLRGPEFVVERANLKYFEIIGRSDILNKPVVEVVPESKAQGFIARLTQVYRTGQPYFGVEEPLTFRVPSGETKTIYLDFVYQPLFDDQERIEGIFVQGNEVTEKVLARQSIEKSKTAIEVERENFRNLFRHTPELVCILSGPEHVFEFVNQSHVRVLGFDATGMRVRDAQPESVEIHGILDSVYRTGETAELFETPVTVGSSLRYFNLTYAAKRNIDGRIDGVMVLGIEVTDEIRARQALRDSEQRYKLVFDESPIPKWIFDIETLKIIDVNRAAIVHYGYSREEFLSLRITDIRPQDEKGRFEEQMRQKRELEQTYLFKGLIHQKKSGELIHVEVSTNDILIEGHQVRLAAVVDVTERVLIEHKQRELVAHLEAARRAAERANDLKSSFLANMSHEIRTPLSAMIGYADLLRDPTFSEAERNEFVEIMIRNGQELTHLIDDILDLSKVESGHLKIEKATIDLQQISHEVISLLGLKAKEKEIDLILEIDPKAPQRMVTDPLRLKQILTNIIGNAIKFTRVGRVFMSVYAESSDQVVFDVIDTGIGISDEEKGKLFQAFSQADSTVTRRFGGTGLGLALSKRLAQALGGNVTLAHSQVGQGSTFRIWIPRDISVP